MKNFITYPTALLLGLGLLAAPKADAQTFAKRKKYNSIGFSLNAMNYFGDVTPTTSFTSLRFGATRPNVGVSITRRFYPRISGRLALSYGRITGDDRLAANANDSDAKFRYNRNMVFQNDILELSGTVIVDLIEHRGTFLKRPDFVPYVFAGLAGFYHNPKGLYNPGNGASGGTYIALADLKTEGQPSAYSQVQLAIPFGGGVRYRINRNFDAALEIGWRKTFTDYLDDVSTTYHDLGAGASQQATYFSGVNTSNPNYPINTLSTDGNFKGFNADGAKRGTSDKTDWYIVTGLSLNYIMPNKIKNPKFRSQ